MVTTEVIMSNVTFYAWVLSGVIVVSLAAWWYFYYRKFNKIVWVRDESSAGNRLFVDKARVIIDKNHVEMWRTFKTKITMAPPSPEAITLTNKGTQMAELLRFGKDNYKWISFGKMPLENLEAKPTLLTTAQKQVLANQYRMAMEESSTSGAKVLEKVLPIILVAILLLFGYMHFDLYSKNSQKIMESYQNIAAQQAAISAENAKLIEATRDIIQNRQTATTGTGGNIVNTPKTPIPN